MYAVLQGKRITIIENFSIKDKWKEAIFILMSNGQAD